MVNIKKTEQEELYALLKKHRKYGVSGAASEDEISDSEREYLVDLAKGVLILIVLVIAYFAVYSVTFHDTDKNGNVTIHNPGLER